MSPSAYALLSPERQQRRLASNKKWRDANLEKARAGTRRWIAIHRDEKREKDRIRRQQPEVKARQKRPDDPEKETRRHRLLRVKTKEKVFNHYGNACACCGETTKAFLTLGHVNGDGAAHRKIVGSHVLEDVIRQGYPDTFRLECFNCNCGSYKNGGICPHKNGGPKF